MAPIEPDLKEDFLKKFGFGAFFKRIFVYILPEMAPLCTGANNYEYLLDINAQK